MLEQLLLSLIKRKAQLEQDTLLHPPADYAGLRESVGRYDEVIKLIKDVEYILEGKEDE